MKEEVNVVKKWIEKAERDLDNSEFNFNHERYEEACFFAQQSAEKILKALDIQKSGNFVKSHDLVFLAKQVNASVDIIVRCRKLKPVYTESRYPDFLDVSPYTKEKSVEIVNDAKEILKWARKQLKN